MSDPNWLLSTLAQSTAAVVAIVGGFLVSRLVQLSSEKEGLRRRLASLRDELGDVTQRYQVAHNDRLLNSRQTFFGWVVDDLVTRDESYDEQALLETNIPRGSSLDEMSEYLGELSKRVDAALANVHAYLRIDDTRDISIYALRERGMRVPAEDRAIYDSIEQHILDELPERSYNVGVFESMLNPVPNLRLPRIESPAIATTEMRRLDDSIREEQELLSRRSLLQAEIARLAASFEQIGKPVGVTPAVCILGVYSLLGIVAPVAVMAFIPTTIAAWLGWTLVGLFIVGLALVVAYIRWYSSFLTRDFS